MTRVILLMLLAVASSSAMAEWVNLGENDVFTAYANTDLIHRSGDNVDMTIMFNYNVTYKVEDGKPFRSIKVQKAYDCKTKRYRQLAMVVFSEWMGGGQSIYDDSNVREWSRIKPNSLEEMVFNYACGKK